MTTATLPPQDLDAERSLLGSILLVNDTYDSIATVVNPGSFYHQANRLIFTAFREMYDRGCRGIDAVTLLAEIKARGILEEIGGVSYLHQVLETVPHADHAEYYAGIVRDRWMRRRLIEESARCTDLAHNNPDDAESIVAQAEKAIASIGDSHVGQVAEMPTIMDEIAAIICERIDSDGKSGVGLPTGLPDLDEAINGLCKTQMIVLAARPSMGKTALVGNIAAQLSREKHPGLFISLEMGREELAERLLCEEAKIDGKKLQTGQLDEIDHYSFSEASARMKAWPLMIDDEAFQKISYLCAKIRRARRVHKIEWCIVDYLQLIQADDPRMIREQQVADMARQLKLLAKDLKIPIVVLSQLNRGIENREDKKPRLSDLRESGAIEQDADIVMFLHRPEQYDPDDRPGEADLIIAKNRHGEVGTVKLTWSKKQLRFRGWQPVEGVADF